MTTKLIPSDWLKHLITCEGCGEMATKDWAKQGEQGIMCQRCAIKIESYRPLKRLGENK